ncbi:MAG: bifunctional DNA-formamidopyrimidine glycosylase/DNA-(apurinic or apyrimidinic site) lyase [Bacillota bacterium]
MPELPEVETVRRTLAPLLTGARIEKVTVQFEPYLRDCSALELVADATGQGFRRLVRHGKYLYLVLDDFELEVHLGMTGKLTVSTPKTACPPHTHVTMELDSGRELRFTDARRFGFLALRPAGAAQERARTLGPEPLTPGFTREALQAALERRKAPVKALLLDQKLVAGLGNIYADEALFRSGIHPARPACYLSGDDLDALYSSTNQVIREAVAARGTSFSDYVDGTGLPGDFSACLRVYGREGLPCPRCGHPLGRLKVAGRSSYHCPACQVR